MSAPIAVLEARPLPFMRRIAEPVLDPSGPRTLEEMTRAYKESRARLDAPGRHLKALTRAAKVRTRIAAEQAEEDARREAERLVQEGRRKAQEIAARAIAKAGFVPIPSPTVRLIVDVVAAHFRVTRVDILSSRRTKDAVLPRHIVMHLAKTLSTLSLPDIGRRLVGRDHTTVLHGVRKIAAMIEADPDFAVVVGNLRAEIEARVADV